MPKTGPLRSFCGVVLVTITTFSKWQANGTVASKAVHYFHKKFLLVWALECVIDHVVIVSGIQSSGSNQALGDFHSPTPSPLPHSYGHVSGHTIISQSSTMPTLSSLHAAGQFTAPSSNSVAYSMSTHNPTSYGSNQVSAYSTNAYGLSNAHHSQVTFTNPVSASLVNNIGQLSNNPLSGLQSNLSNITGNVGGMNLGGGMGGSSLPVTLTSMSGTGFTSCLNNVQTNLSGGLSNTLGGMQSTLTGGLSNALSNLVSAPQLSSLTTSLANTNNYGTGTYTNPLISGGLGTNTMNIKLKSLDELDLGLRYGVNSGVGRVATPVTPHQPPWNLGLDNQFGNERLATMDGFNVDRNRTLARILPHTSGHEMEGN